MNEERKAQQRREAVARYRQRHPDRIREYKQRPHVRQADRDRMRQRRANRTAEKRIADNARMRAANLLRHYGVSLEEYEKALRAQDGRCAICRSTHPGHNISNSFHIDHDHKSGEFRGLLCNHCNRGLGAFKDNPKLLVAAIEYLQVNVRVIR